MPVFKPFAGHPAISSIASRYMWSVPVVAFFGLLNGVLEGLGIGLLVPLLSTLLNDGDGTAAPGGVLGYLGSFAAAYPAEQRLLIVAATMFGFVLLKGVSQYASRSFSAWIDGRAAHDILSSLSERLERNDYAFHLSVSASRLVNIISSEAWKVSDAVRAVLTSISSLANVVVFAALLFFVSWQLALLVCAGALIVRLIQGQTTVRLKRFSEDAGKANERLADRMLFAIYGARVIRLFNQEQDEHERFAAASNTVRTSHLVIERFSAVLGSVLETLHAALFLITLLVGVSIGVEIPVLAAFLVLLNRMQPHLRTLETSGLAVAGSNAQLREVEWLLDAKQTAPSQEGRAFQKLETSIDFENVGFTYAEREAKAALQDVSFSFRRGCTTALIGHSGSGKSTVINLLCRLLEPGSGRIMVNDFPLSDTDSRQWRRAIGIAGQDIDLVEGTIADNIAFGVLDMPFADIQEAARLAHADDFIESFPEGYQTRVGGRGLALSGGQRQRIGIARALGRKPQILILDEATNAVDGLSEKKLFELLQTGARDRTTIVISHHASTLSFCDWGVVLADGKVIETGPLNDLAGFKSMLMVT